MTPEECETGRRLAGLSQEALAEAANVSTGVLASFINRLHWPYEQTIASLKTVLLAHGVEFTDDGVKRKRRSNEDKKPIKTAQAAESARLAEVARPAEDARLTKIADRERLSEERKSRSHTRLIDREYNEKGIARKQAEDLLERKRRQKFCSKCKFAMQKCRVCLSWICQSPSCKNSNHICKGPKT